ncbi:MAG: methyl-accepting chemotaxis protein [Lacrimispora sp.]|jgi:methyl-accepting chemotaxis protein|nr:methyl-accepting chemotaxis protein [Lacrimispora sp.]
MEKENKKALKQKSQMGGKITDIVKNKSIKKRLLFGIIGMAVTISATYGLINGMMFYRDAKNNIELRLTECATAYSQSVENSIDLYRARIEFIAQNPEITDPSLSTDQRTQLLAQVAKDNGFATLSIAGADGKTSDGGDASEREYFKQSIAGNTYISSTIVSKVTGKTVLIVSAKVKSENYNGIVIATLDSDTFSTMIDGVEVGESGYGFIIDKEGKIIAHKNRDRVNDQTNYIETAKTDKNYQGTSDEMKDMIAGKTGIQTVNFKGVNMTTGYTPIEGTDGWSIGIVTKESEMMSSFRSSLIYTMLITLIMIILSFVIAFRIAKPIVKPILDLVNRIRLLEEGDLHSPVPQINSGNELDMLSKSFTGTVATLNSYINEISVILSSLEKGDCTVSVNQDYKGDFVQIKDSLSGIILNLNSVLGNIRVSSDQVAEGSRQISGASQSLATGATEQAATVEELNASISNVSSQAEENAKRVDNATRFVKEAVSGVREGNECMGQLDRTMKEIGAASEKIKNITKVIEDIAFQTNILALNAAVESARAGEAGKGFAVVADEVRNLAAKSAEAAKQTADLIGYSVATISEGGKLADQSAGILKVVEEKAGLVDGIIQEIALASKEQVQAMEEINQGLSQVSTVVQNNAATAEESSASSEELDSLAQSLKQAVETFKLRKDIEK